MSDRLAVVETEKAEYEESHEAELKRLEVEKAEYAELLDTVEKEKIETEKQLGTASTQLNEMKSENADLKKQLEDMSNQLNTAKAEKNDAAEAKHKKYETELPKSSTRKTSNPKLSIADKFRESTTLEDRVEIGRKVANLRINSAESRKMSWANIRGKLGLHNDEFHKVIRLESHFHESVVERIESFEDGWEYNGKLEDLLGFKPVGELATRIEACKPRQALKSVFSNEMYTESQSDSESPAKSPKSQRKWRRSGAVAALRDPAKIQETEAKIAKILNPSEKARLERELREAKRAVDGS